MVGETVDYPRLTSLREYWYGKQEETNDDPDAGMSLFDLIPGKVVKRE